MTPQEFMTGLTIGKIVQVVWKGPQFAPDAIVKSGDKVVPLSKIYSSGFVADFGTDYICIGIDTMMEAGNTVPSFRSLLTIPISNIISAEIYGTATY
jgi:galactitol-specific phosphotransferase system IIC component